MIRPAYPRRRAQLAGLVLAGLLAALVGGPDHGAAAQGTDAETPAIVPAPAAAPVPAVVPARARTRKPALPLAHPPEPAPVAAVAGDSTAALAVTMTAELVQVEAANGRTVQRLLPADHVVPGDLVIYTVQVRNTSAVPMPAPQFTAPIPEHTSYVADSAVGPGADISFSVDRGISFDKPQNLVVRGADGVSRPATAADYTHIRWTLRHAMRANSVAYARFRARLN